MSEASGQWSLSSQEAAAAVDGKLDLIGSGGLADTVFHGVGTDSRSDLQGRLFVALVGENHDAHVFLSAAVKNNATGLLVHRELTKEEVEICTEISRKNGMPIAVIVVPDTLSALQQLARHWRHKCKTMILGITGSNGKTSTKEFATSILQTRFKVQSSKGSLNNHWGVPISLLSIEPSHDVAVIEMGMNHRGELQTLSKIADADVVVCTMVGRGHLEGVGSLAGVAEAKSEVYEFAPKKATFIFNLDNEYTNQMMSRFAGEGRRTLTFGQAAGDISFRIKKMTAESLELTGEIKGISGNAVVSVFGQHNVTNLMAAASLSLAAGMSPQEIWQALPLCRSAWGRNQWVNLKSGARVLFDGYNANPESMQAALENSKLLLAPSAEFAGRGVAVLGEMRELGEFTREMHEELGRMIRNCGFRELIFIGPSCAAVRSGFEQSGPSPGVRTTFLPAYTAEVAEDLRARLSSGDYVLIKGSRGMNLEVFLKALEPLDFKAKQ